MLIRQKPWWSRRRWRAIGLAAGLSLSLVGGSSVFAQQNPLPGRTATVILGQPDAFSAGAGSGPAQMSSPSDALIDPVSKKVFVLDVLNRRVLRFASYESLETGAEPEHIFGGPCSTTVTASCMFPAAIDLDGKGRLWVADIDLGRVLRFDNAVSATDNIADGVLGAPDFESLGTLPVIDIVIAGANGDLLIALDDGRSSYQYWDLSPLPADNAAPNNNETVTVIPSGIGNGMAYDYASGGLWIQDYSGNRILYFSDPSNLTTPQGVIGQPSLIATGSGAGAAGLSLTYGLWASDDGTLFVHDNFRVLAYRNAATRAMLVPTSGVAVSADAVWGADDFDSPGYRDVATYGAAQTNGLTRFGGDPSNNVLALASPVDNRTLIFGDVPAPEAAPTAVPVAVCRTLPDMAVAPERIELAAGAATSITITLRNLCSDAPFNGSDLLLSLSDGLSVTDGSAGMVNLGRRAAWQGLSLAPGETRSWSLTVQAEATLPTAPIFVVELYNLGGVAKRIDGIFVVTALSAAAPAAAAVEAAAAAPSSAVVLPAALPNTAGADAPDAALPLAALLLAALGGVVLVLRRR